MTASLSARARGRRWSDNQRRWGPFTYARDTHGKPFGIVLDSGGGDYDSAGCHLRLRAFGHTLLVELPAIIKPREVVNDWDRGPHACEYGFQFSGSEAVGNRGNGFLQIFFGPQTNDSLTTKSWSCFLPWKDWRHIRRSLFDDKGEHFWTEWDRRGALRDNWMARQAIEKACPCVVFEFDDHDGKRIRATTRIEEREWHFGTKWCRWLSIFRKPMLRRSLDIEFSEEVGPEKGSWKGGTLGTSTEMLPGEISHEAAFRRYCAEQHRSKYRRYSITFVGRASI